MVKSVRLLNFAYISRNSGCSRGFKNVRKLYVYCMFLDKPVRLDPFVPCLTTEHSQWSELTSNHLNWNSRPNFVSKRIDPIWSLFDYFGPSLTYNDFRWPDLITNNIEFEFFIQFWVETCVYWMYFDPIWP